MRSTFVLCALLGQAACAPLEGAWNSVTHPYALDSIERRVTDPEAPLGCTPNELETYRGTHVTLAPIVVHPAFIERLQRFELAAQEIGEAVYGRPPTKIHHFGGYACRRSTGTSGRLSEHALGNAIDVARFDFSALLPEQSSVSAPSLGGDALAGAFSVRILKHWSADERGAPSLHREFLRRLAKRIVSESIFRVAIGPSQPGHEDHLHLDMAPYRYHRL